VTRKPALEVDEKTSRRLGLVRQRGTRAELEIRGALHALGHRFRVTNRDLPGSPDIANRKKKWAVFVHGCFWHRHQGCRRATTPKRNRDFWIAKFARNVERDEQVATALGALGWLVVIAWECEIELDRAAVAKRVSAKLQRWSRRLALRRGRYVTKSRGARPGER
jgi:DNA mismatch endonuclease (patch repair protein)